MSDLPRWYALENERLRAWAHDERLGHGPLLLDAAAEIERLRDIISPGDAAAYEEGMAALLARCEAAEARLAEAERLLQECFDARATTPSIGLVYRVGHYLNHRNDATQEPTR